MRLRCEGKHFTVSEVTPFIDRYNLLKQMNEMGFTQDLDSLDGFDEAVFICIGNCVTDFRNSEMKKQARENKKGLKSGSRRRI